MTRPQITAELSRLSGHLTAIGLMNYLSRRAFVADEAINLEDAATCDLERALATLRIEARKEAA